jgi:hypothetical protein
MISCDDDHALGSNAAGVDLRRRNTFRSIAIASSM